MPDTRRTARRVAAKRSKASPGRRLLFGGWLASALIGLACGSIFVAGLLRDTHFGQAELPLNLGASSGWQRTEFRVWGGGEYVLWLTTLRQGAPFGTADTLSRTEAQDRGFEGVLVVRILEPGGQKRLERRYGGEGFGGPTSGELTWVRLDSPRLDGLPFRTWRLEARVAEGDAALAAGPGVRSRLLLRKDRPDPGMGGLINYAMIFPAAAFLLLSLGLAIAIARRGGSRTPIWISGVLVTAFAALFVT